MKFRITNKQKSIFRRFFYIFITEIIISMISVGLNQGGIFVQREAVSVSLIISAAVFLVINFRAFWYDAKIIRKKKIYYRFNVCASFLFLCISLLMKFILPNDLYVWCFVLTRFLCYTKWAPGFYPSFAIFYAIFFVMMLTVPFIRKLYRKLYRRVDGYFKRKIDERENYYFEDDHRHHGD